MTDSEEPKNFKCNPHEYFVLLQLSVVAVPVLIIALSATGGLSTPSGWLAIAAFSAPFVFGAWAINKRELNIDDEGIRRTTFRSVVQLRWEEIVGTTNYVKNRGRWGAGSYMVVYAKDSRKIEIGDYYKNSPEACRIVKKRLNPVPSHSEKKIWRESASSSSVQIKGILETLKETLMRGESVPFGSARLFTNGLVLKDKSTPDTLRRTYS